MASVVPVSSSRHCFDVWREVDGDILFDEQDATRLTILVNARLLKTENTKKISIVKGVLEVSATVRLSRKSGK